MKTKIMKWAFIAGAILIGVIAMGVLNYFASRIISERPIEFFSFILTYTKFLFAACGLIAVIWAVLFGLFQVFKKIYTKLFD